MFWNNVKIALRNLRKNKGFAAINITGLAIGLTVYVFGGLIVEYERHTRPVLCENVQSHLHDRRYSSPRTERRHRELQRCSICGGAGSSRPIFPTSRRSRGRITSEYLINDGCRTASTRSIRFADPALLADFRTWSTCTATTMRLTIQVEPC